MEFNLKKIFNKNRNLNYKESYENYTPVNVKSSYVNENGETIEYEKELYTIEPLLSLGCAINFCDSKRNIGKSFSLKYQVVKTCIDEDRPSFIYLRRKQEDIDKSKVEKYINDRGVIAEIQKYQKEKGCTENEIINEIFYKSNTIYMTHKTKQGKRLNTKILGFAVAVNDSVNVKSYVFDKVKYFVLEEYQTMGSYLEDELIQFNSIISTCGRSDFFQVVLLGNLEDVNNPYYSYYGITNVDTQEDGTIDIYEIHTKQYRQDGSEVIVKVAREMCYPYENPSEVIVGDYLTHTSSNSFVSYIQPTMGVNEADSYKTLYTIIVRDNNRKFKCEFKRDNKTSGYFWYICKYSDKWKLNKRQRIITNEVEINPYSTCGFIALDDTESLMFSYLQQEKMFFNSNLTGTDFKRTLQRFGINVSM